MSEDCELNILTANDEKGLAALRHTASHVLAEAVKNLYQDKTTIGPSLIQDFTMTLTMSLSAVRSWMHFEKEMKKIIKKGAKIQRYTMPREEAIKFMEEKGEDYKVELIKDLPEGEEISFLFSGFCRFMCRPSFNEHKGSKSI